MKFKLESTDVEENCKNTSEFTAGTWAEALDYFVKFLRGNGYKVEDGSVGVDADKNPYVSLEDLPNLTYFYTGE